MKSKINIIYGILGMLIFCWLLFSVSGIEHVCQLFFSEKNFAPKGTDNAWLHSFAEDIKVISKKSFRFQLKNITPFAWDKLYIVPPYTTDIQIISRFGFRPKLLGCTRIYTMDDRNLIIFMSNGELTAFGDISNIIVWPDVSTQDAAFLSNTSWLCLREKNEDYVVLDICDLDAKSGGSILINPFDTSL